MTYPVMIGPHAIKEAVTSYLATDLPSRLIVYRNRWQLREAALLNPRKYLSWEPEVADEWPMVFTVVDRTTGIKHEDYSETGDPVYAVDYDLRTIVWARGGNAHDAEFVRDRLTTVIRASLLDNMALNGYLDESGCYFKIQSDSMREEYGDTYPLKGERLAAGGAVSYRVSLLETIGRATLGSLVEAYVVVDLMDSGVPGAPRRAHATTMAGASIVSWVSPPHDGGPNEYLEGYAIRQSTDHGTTWTTTIPNTESLTPMWLVSGLTPGTDYRFQVAAINGIGQSEWSNPTNEVTPT